MTAGPSSGSVDSEALADEIAKRLKTNSAEDSKARWVTSAGGAVGLIAGAVALVYLLGGLIFAVRLRLDGSSVAETASLVGQLPREYLITTGLVQAVGTAALVGLAASGVLALALVFDRLDGPWPEVKPENQRNASDWPNLGYKLGGHVPTWLALVSVAVGLIAPAVIQLLGEDSKSLVEIASVTAAFLITYSAVAVGWYVRRLVGGPRTRTRSIAEQAMLGGLIWVGIAIPPATIYASFVGLENARACVARSSTAIEGELVADTAAAVLLIAEFEGDETVIRIPARRLTRLDYGAAQLPDCPKS